MYAGCFRLLTLSEGFIKQISENTEAEMQELPMPCVPLEKGGDPDTSGDCLKCVAAIVLVRVFLGKTYGDILPLLSLYAAAGCILGHNFPFYLKFRGGKGIAASVGFILAFDWRIFLICAVIFLRCSLRPIMCPYAL